MRQASNSLRLFHFNTLDTLVDALVLFFLFVLCSLYIVNVYQTKSVCALCDDVIHYSHYYSFRQSRFSSYTYFGVDVMIVLDEKRCNRDILEMMFS